MAHVEIVEQDELGLLVGRERATLGGLFEGAERAVLFDLLPLLRRLFVSLLAQARSLPLLLVAKSRRLTRLHFTNLDLCQDSNFQDIERGVAAVCGPVWFVVDARRLYMPFRVGIRRGYSLEGWQVRRVLDPVLHAPPRRCPNRSDLAM